MVKDVVVPKGNEKQFIKRAKLLGYTHLVMCYQKVPEKVPADRDLKITVARFAPSNPKRQKGVMVIAADSSKVRQAAEHPAVDALVGMEKDQRDFIHHRGSGINQVIARLLARKEKEYYFDFSLLLHAQAKTRGQLIGRMRQNMMLLKKAGVKVQMVSMAKDPSMMRAPKDLQAVMRMIAKN